MKALKIIFISIFLFLPGIAAADPIAFQSIVDFSGSIEPGTGVTYSTVFDTTPFLYSHIVNFDPPACDICEAAIAFTHKGNNYSTGELWMLFSGTDIKLGNLSNSTGATGWVTDSFVISPSLYPTLPADSWPFAVKLLEGGTATAANIAIDKSMLSGKYNCAVAVPEPATMLLFGSGLLGLWGFRRKFKK